MNEEILRRDSYHIDDKNWYYETPKGIEVIHHRGPNDFIHIIIPWFKVMRSVDRYKLAVSVASTDEA